MGTGFRSCRRTGAVAGVALLALLAPPALADHAGAAVRPDGGPRAVVAGKARFEVLSPTLIRTEYAGDGRFTQAATFNAVGRDAFPRTPYTTSTRRGWLTLRTSAMTLKYRIGSGDFGPGNLTMTQRSHATHPATARPWSAAASPGGCRTGAVCEAEDQPSRGLPVDSDHGGYTGSGFAAGFESSGDALSVPVDVPRGGTGRLLVRYANGTGKDGKHTARTLSLSADGGTPRRLRLPATTGWDTWRTAAVPLRLPAGRHTLNIRRSPGTSGQVNIDRFVPLAPGATRPTSPERACRFGAVCEAETGHTSGGATRTAGQSGYSGTGFVTGLGHSGARETLRVSHVPRPGTYALQLHYATGTARPTVSVTTGAAAHPVRKRLPATSGWDSWRTAAVPVRLSAGTNKVTVASSRTTSSQLHLDTAAATPRTARLLPAHTPLGGYRRSLDGVNGDDGNPLTTPGILYEDGWTLLDDTSSALFDPATGNTHPRPTTHNGRSYQDGYVFAYGHHYRQALADLATLTGPPRLLPHWAYGVWYSEYIDRTAADYERRLLPRFRSEGVPLDVLVTDTDFKSPDTWNGWQADPAKFPDPRAFFAWSKAHGLHNTLNIHPSIRSNDPQYAQAQATAHGRLQTSTGCPAATGGGAADCHIFDWGDTAQLKAYMNLHRALDRAGNDFWWLDWCCDASRSTRPGVTPDAWINQQYAHPPQGSRAAARPGFVLSRAYGSLDSGNYNGRSGTATGPWAEKRTTLHFTGDTASSWGTLRAEAGSTPAESAATGLPAVSHDIGGHNDTTGLPGSEFYTSDGQRKRTTKLPDDLYARWIQLGTFQPIDRLHSNHSDRLPWQYGPAAEKSAKRFLNLRERLLPYTYALARQATATGTPITRALYLNYPGQQGAYAHAGSEYLYGPSLLVAPVTTRGKSATTQVWFPPGRWTDLFTGRVHRGPATEKVTTTLGTMPVFAKAGSVIPLRTADVPNDAQHPQTALTLNIATGASGSFALHDGNARRATAGVHYTEGGGRHSLRISPAGGPSSTHAPRHRWTALFTGTTAPRHLTLNGKPLRHRDWTYHHTTRSLKVHLRPGHPRQALTLTYR